MVYLDLCKVLAMFLVVWGHAIQHFIYGMEGFAHDAVWRFIQSFHMPLFMMIAGFFSSSSMKLSFWDLVKKKAKQLILPCVSWGVLSFVLLHFTLGNNLSFLTTIIENFWFLKSVFICYLLGWMANAMKGILRYGGAFLLILFVTLFMGKYDVTRMFPCFLAGMLLKQKGYRWIEKEKFLYGSFIVFVVLLIFWNFDESIWLRFGSIQECLQMTFGWGEYVYKYIFRIAVGLAGSFFVMSLSYHICLDCHFFDWQKISKMGQYTLGVYILQTFLLERIMAKIIHLNNYNYEINILILTPILAFFVFVICVVVDRLISKSKILGSLLFGKK